MTKKLARIICIVFLLLTITSLFLMSKVKVNYDITKYLNEDSQTKQALNILEEEFGNNGYLQIMIENVEEGEIGEIKELINNDNIKNISYTYKDNNILLEVIFLNNDYAEETQNTLKTIITTLEKNNYSFYMRQQAYQTYNYNLMINEQIPKIILFLVPVILIILFLTTTTYLDPLIFIIVVLVSIALNMGTNAFLKDVSYMTNAIGAILQFAICMDYSIILLNRYRQYKKIEQDEKHALSKAWKSSLVPILASSLTTIAGFIAIMFMRYRIGTDIGIVLIKGVVLTLITALGLMPALIILFDKLMQKTTHKKIFKTSTKFTRFIFKTRFILPVIVLSIIVVATFMQTKNTYKYSDNTFSNEGEQMEINNKKIENVFGISNQIVIMIDKNINTNEIINKLEDITLDEQKHITSSISIDKQLTKLELMSYLKEYNISESEIDFILNLKIINKETVSLNELFNLFNKLKDYKGKKNILDMYSYVNNFFDVTVNDISYLYNMIGSESLSLEDIINNLKQTYTKEEMKTMFNMMDINSISIVYDTLKEEQITIFTFMNFYQNILNTKYTPSALSSIFNGSLTIEEITNLYSMFNEESMSIIEILNRVNKTYSKEEMKLILPYNSDLIDNCYLILNTNNNSNFLIKDVLNCIIDNFSSYLTSVEQTNITSFINQLSLFDTYQIKLEMLNSFFPLIMTVENFNFSLLIKYEMLDLSIIKGEFIGERLQRIILTTDLTEESDESFTFFSSIKQTLTENVDEYYIVSNTTAVMDIKELSTYDNKIVNIISIALIFIIILLSFASISIPIILIILIEGAIFINMAIPAIINEPLFFTGYLLVSCIQLGATIDYGILLCNRYIINRKKNNKKEAMNSAINESLSSILTSGLILTTAGLLLAFISEVPVIAILGRLIGIGGITSVLIVTIILPQVLYISDSFIKKTTIKANFLN